MAARGTESKNIVFNKLQEVFKDTFWEDEGKILRIPLTEGGERIEIKVSLTAAKTNLGEGIASAFEVTPIKSAGIPSTEATEPVNTEISQEEKDNIRNLIASLGL